MRLHRSHLRRQITPSVLLFDHAPQPPVEHLRKILPAGVPARLTCDQQATDL